VRRHRDELGILDDQLHWLASLAVTWLIGTPTSLMPGGRFG
jgi:hypothetical protein